jgi:hypothetical protein
MNIDPPLVIHLEYLFIEFDIAITTITLQNKIKQNSHRDNRDPFIKFTSPSSQKSFFQVQSIQREK